MAGPAAASAVRIRDHGAYDKLMNARLALRHVATGVGALAVASRAGRDAEAGNIKSIAIRSRFPFLTASRTNWQRQGAMIHHVSIPAREPRHVAEVLAELMGGKCHPFGPLDGAFMATSGDEHGTMIEVYPERATLDIPASDDQVVFGENKAPPNTWPFHVLLSVPLEPDEIERIGSREGWRAKTFGRGMQGQKPFFHVIEFWLENRLMIEVVSPAMAREYEDFLKNAQNSVMSDPESQRLMRATHIKEPA
jgi:hypothetical protein